ncbi:hypothetical protein ABT025_18480 [Streptomyces sp. NPDC002809]|uniref:hypothetical protein n=1 Tax=Streptomyces sp. NPDC002809 TaxID=3154433 RepID=UPI00331AEC44
MGHAVMTHTKNPNSVSHSSLEQDRRDRFDKAMDEADNTADALTYHALMCVLIVFAGFTDPRVKEVLKCACQACYCDLIFDAEAPGALVTEAPTGYNLGRLQCPDCADDHPRPVED